MIMSYVTSITNVPCHFNSPLLSFDPPPPRTPLDRVLSCQAQGQRNCHFGHFGNGFAKKKQRIVGSKLWNEKFDLLGALAVLFWVGRLTQKPGPTADPHPPIEGQRLSVIGHRGGGVACHRSTQSVLSHRWLRPSTPSPSPSARWCLPSWSAT